MAAYVPLTAFKRVPFVEPDGATIVKMGDNFASGSFRMEIRANPGDTGTALVALTNAAAGTEGISAIYDASYTYADENGVSVTGPATKLLIQINEATLEALALGTPYNEPLTLFYDLHITPAGGIKFVLCEGEFIIKPGVTI